MAIFIKTTFFRTHLVAGSKLKCNISNANFDKSKKKLSYILILPMQTKQKIFSYIVNFNKNLKKTDEKKCCFKHT